jgi:hypothetical protein
VPASKWVDELLKHEERLSGWDRQFRGAAANAKIERASLIDIGWKTMRSSISCVTVYASGVRLIAPAQRDHSIDFSAYMYCFATSGKAAAWRNRDLQLVA